MDRDYFTNLTNDLYRLTLLFPKKDPLRYKMRDLANNILANLTMILERDNHKEYVEAIKRDIGPLDSFFEVAKGQNWVSLDDILDVQERYTVIKEEVDRFEETPKKVLSLEGLNKRQKKIVEILGAREAVQVNDVQIVFPDITKRTIRRDFDALVKNGLVKREGKANLTYYKLADNEL